MNHIRNNKLSVNKDVSSCLQEIHFDHIPDGNNPILWFSKLRKNGNIENIYASNH